MMKYFPIQIVDDFFDNPDEIVKFANSLKFKRDKFGDWPGERTDYLHNIDKTFFNEFLGKVLALSFDYKYHNITWENVQLSFQKTKPIDIKNKNNILNRGLIHRDGDYPLVGLVYLNKNADPESGTSIFNLKNNIAEPSTKKIKQEIYSKKFNELKNKDFENLKKLLTTDQNSYYETCRVNNIYNRLFAYDGNNYHRANSFFTGEEERLTLVFFIKQINSSVFFPAQRSRNYKLNEKNDNTKGKLGKKRNN